MTNTTTNTTPTTIVDVTDRMTVRTTKSMPIIAHSLMARPSTRRATPTTSHPTGRDWIAPAERAFTRRPSTPAVEPEIASVTSIVTVPEAAAPAPQPAETSARDLRIEAAELLRELSYAV